MNTSTIKRKDDSMTPMEAWHIISANLLNLYKMRRALNNNEKGYTQTEIDAEVICFEALKEMEEREKEK